MSDRKVITASGPKMMNMAIPSMDSLPEKLVPSSGGGDAKNMKEEFAVYGLPMWFMYTVACLKVLLAASLILGVWLPIFTQPAAIGMAVLMLGAVLMHVKVKDPIKKALPALNLLILCLVVATLTGLIGK